MVNISTLIRQTQTLMKSCEPVFRSWLEKVTSRGCSHFTESQHHHLPNLCQYSRNITCSVQVQSCSKNNPSRMSIITRRIHILSTSNCPVVTSNAARNYLWTYSYLHGDKQSHIFWNPRRRKSSQQKGPTASNPLLELQPFVPQPILEDNELIFAPSEADITKATKLFVPSSKHRIEFIKGAYYPAEAPDYSLPEIAFIGRSNVGKSSLIKALFSQVKGLTVRTSKTPGHTKLLLFFQVGKAFSLVDMPGYGFNQPANFITSAEGFLKNRKNLRNTFLLIDSSVGLQRWDYVAIDMLEEFSIPYLIVLTKSDKASKRELIESIMTVTKVIREHTHGCLPQPFLVSAKSGSGLSLLKGFIAYTTGNLQLQE